MPFFSRNVFAKVIAVLNVFETSRPAGNSAALAVLNDGAGISYGSSQFTHKSGSLARVIKKYLESSSVSGRAILEKSLPQLEDTSESSVAAAAKNIELKNTLRAAGATKEMQAAQMAVLIEMYLLPAENTCRSRGWVEPLSLAVVFDSIVHGSFGPIEKKVKAAKSGEKNWISEYVTKRDAWLASSARLKPTRYRTQFFLQQIKAGNWELAMPITAHGVRIGESTIAMLEAMVPNDQLNLPFDKDPAAGPADQSPSETHEAHSEPSLTSFSDSRPPDDITNTFKRVEECVDDGAAKYDRVETVVRKVTTRTDSAKSLWTTIVGTIWQTAWALMGIAAGIPREVWLVVAVIAASLMLVYLYRQLTLGKIREQQGVTNNA